MTDEEIKFLLSEDNDEVLQAHKEIVSLQKDKSSLLIFGKSWLDDNIVAGINNKILFFGSRPGGGKTYHCSETINALLNRELNPTPTKVCRFNLEMPTQTLLLQQISRTLKKTPREILSQPYSEEEKPIITKIVGAFKDKRIKNISRVLVGENFRKFVLEFIKEIDEEDNYINEVNLEALLSEIQNEEEKEVIRQTFAPKKTKKVCLIDHLHIYRSKDEIDTILLICNELKMLDKNLSFIIYFQLRRDVEDLWRDSKDKKVNPRNILPNSTYIYQTDVLQQVADIVVGMVIPQVYDLDDFAAVHKERNQHLKEHFSNDTTDSNYTRVKGRNRIYYNYMKIRLINSFDDPRLFCDILDAKYEETANKIYEENKNPFLNSSSTPLPVFNALNFEKEIMPAPKSLNEAFGEPPKDNKSPF